MYFSWAKLLTEILTLKVGSNVGNLVGSAEGCLVGAGDHLRDNYMNLLIAKFITLCRT